MDDLPQNPLQLLAQIKQKANELAHLNQILNKYLEPILIEHCRVANWRENNLIIEVDSSAWATRLRFLAPDLWQKLSTHKEFSTLQHIKWYIRPIAEQINQTESKQLTLSNESAELIAETATHISNPELQAALQKLAKHKRGK